MKRKFFSRLLCLVMVLALLPTAALAAGEVVASGYCGADEDGKNLSWALTADGTLTISGTGAMKDYSKDYSYNSSPWEDYKQTIATVVIQEGVTTIGDVAFRYCNALTNVTLPEGLTTIGAEAFEYCNALTDVILPDGLTTLGRWAFYDCDALTNVTFPESLTTIGNYAFEDCAALASVTLPASVTTIGYDGDAFAKCTALTSFTVADGNPAFTAVDGVLFNKDKTALIQYPAASARTTYSIPDSVTTIRDYAFYGCDALTTVTIPASVTYIGEFISCDALTSFAVAVDNPDYTAVDGVLFNKDMTTLIQYPIGKTQDTYAVPDSVTTIGYQAFWDCHALTTVTFPEGLTTIGAGAFEYCDALTDVILPEGLTTLGSGAFNGCEALTSVTLPEGLTTIGDDTFRVCAALTSVTFPKGLTTIGDWAFSYCDSLTNVTLPDGVTTIGEGAFEDCGSLVSVTIPASVTTLDSRAFAEFSDETQMISVRFSGDVPQIGDGKGPFYNRTLTIYYPKGNSTWTEETKERLTSDAIDVTWVGIGPGDEVCAVTVAPAQHGKVTVTPWMGLAGTTATLTITPDEGYELDTLTVKQADGTAVKVTDNTFTMPASDVTVTPTFKELPPETYTVTVWSAQHGKVTASPAKAEAGTKVTLTVTPDSGYELDTLTAKQSDGKTVTVTNNTFTMPASDVTVTPTFKELPPETYTVTVWSAQHGKVTASPAKAEAGTKVTLTVTPDSGYELDALTVKQSNGTTVKVTNNTFTMPASDVTVTPTFKELPPETYTVTVTTAQHGKVTASPAKAEAGTKVTLTATPDSGYELDTLTVKQADGKTVTVAADNTFTMPASDVTVTPTFKALPVDRLSLNRSSVSVSVGSSTSVTATVSGYAGKHVYAISSDTSVATVSVSGKTVRVKGVAQGTATIYVAMTDAAAMTLDQVKADPSVKEIKVTVTKTGTNTGGGGGGSTGGGGGGGTGGGGGGASGGSSSGGSTGGSTGSTPNIPATQTFTDVVKGSWYEHGVTFVVGKGLFNGVGANKFAPNDNMTRAMLMTVLARLAGQSTDGGATWYAKGMDWAKAQGVSDGTNPEGNITREQLVTMLYRYAKSPAVGAADMAEFVDANAVSDWAADAVRWAVQKGILTGKDGARLDPQGTATRAEVATILQRYVEKG